MADTFKFQKDWYEAIINDKYVSTSPQEMAYILYAAMQYAFNDGSPIDLGEVFGSQYGGLNRAMSNIYGQMDKIKNYEKNKNEEKYDNDAIYKLRMEGKTGKEICQILHYPFERERSLSSTKGWIKAREDKKIGIKNTEILQISVKEDENIGGEDTESTEILQKNTDSVQSVTENTESVNTESVQKSVNYTDFNF